MHPILLYLDHTKPLSKNAHFWTKIPEFVTIITKFLSIGTRGSFRRWAKRKTVPNRPVLWILDRDQELTDSKYESQCLIGLDFYISRSDHLRFGRILGHFWGRSHFIFDQSTKVQTILVLLETSKNEGEELYWCFVVLKWVNYKNVLHRKMCNLGQTLSHVWLQHTDTCVTRQIHQNKMIGTLKIPKNVLVPRLCNTNIFLKCTFFRIKK